MRSICILYLKAEWLNDYALLVHVDQLNPVNQWVFSVWVLPSAILLHATEVLHQSWRKGWCHRQTPGPSQVFSRARCFGPTFDTHNDYFQKNTVALNSKLFKSTNHVIYYKIKPIFTRLTSLWLGCHNNQLCCWMHHFQLLGGMKH